MKEAIIELLSEALRPVRGLSALVLGGSRARGIASAHSDYDLGLYYEEEVPLHIEDLRSAIAPLVDEPAQSTVTPVGGWGRWINGGGWLSISNQKVDLLYRDLARVRAVVAECEAGEVSMNYQPGHPHGFCSAIWMGEVATCQPLRDDAGVLAELKTRAWPFPHKLQQALISRFHWEVIFSIENAELAIHRDEQTHIAGCAYRALCCIAQVLFAVNRRYLINEKGALAEAGTFPETIKGVAGTAVEIWAAIGAREFASALRLLRRMASDLDSLVARTNSK
jgi:Nucleotidyltransferase domain